MTTKKGILDGRHSEGTIDEVLFALKVSADDHDATSKALLSDAKRETDAKLRASNRKYARYAREEAAAYRDLIALVNGGRE